MSKMRKEKQKGEYRIRIEEIKKDGEAEPLDKDMDVDKCDGFVIITTRDGDATVEIHNVNSIDIAQAIMQSDILMGASYIADGMRKCNDVHHNSKNSISLSLEELLSGLN